MTTMNERFRSGRGRAGIVATGLTVALALTGCSLLDDDKDKTELGPTESASATVNPTPPAPTPTDSPTAPPTPVRPAPAPDRDRDQADGPPGPQNQQNPSDSHAGPLAPLSPGGPAVIADGGSGQPGGGGSGGGSLIPIQPGGGYEDDAGTTGPGSGGGATGPGNGGGGGTKPAEPANPRPTGPVEVADDGVARDDLTAIIAADFLDTMNRIRTDHGLQPITADQVRIGLGPWSALAQRHAYALTAGESIDPHDGMIASNEVQLGGPAPWYFDITGEYIAKKWWDSPAHRAIIYAPENPDLFDPANGNCLVLNLVRTSTNDDNGWGSHFDARGAVISCENDTLPATAPAGIADYTPPAVKPGVSYDPETATKYDPQPTLDPAAWELREAGGVR